MLVVIRRSLLSLVCAVSAACTAEAPPPPLLITVVNISQSLVGPGETITLHAEATGGDGEISYTWSVEAGTLSGTTGQDLTWIAPDTQQIVGLTLTVDDAGADEPVTFETDLVVGPGIDHDGDGYSIREGDCNDTNTVVYPGAPDAADGIDNDCDGTVDEGSPETDDDGDTFSDVDGDCDDGDAFVFPGSSEAINDSDDDCDGIIDEGTDAYDDDADGVAELDGDCNDESSGVAPGAPETLDGVDNDCDGVVDEGTAAYDDDGDGFSELTGDCDDSLETGELHTPGLDEVSDGIDNDCNGIVDDGWFREDDDGDGWTEDQGDCDDADFYTYPGSVEFEDDADNDCNTLVDDALDTADDDGDGFTEAQGDCDDFLASVSPGAAEVQESPEIDNDCDHWFFTNAPYAVAAVVSAPTQPDVCNLISLTGADSWDPDGDVLEYYWYFAWQPIHSVLGSDDIAAGTTATPTFTPDRPGLWIVGLYVNDGLYNSEPAFLTFDVVQGLCP